MIMLWASDGGDNHEYCAPVTLEELLERYPDVVLKHHVGNYYYYSAACAAEEDYYDADPWEVCEGYVALIADL